MNVINAKLILQKCNKFVPLGYRVKYLSVNCNDSLVKPFNQCNNVQCGKRLYHYNGYQFLKTINNFIILTHKNQFCTSSLNEPENVATYEEVKNLCNHPEILLIDVREPEELKETGQIPTSINIPLGDVISALSFETSEEEFYKKFGRKKPTSDTPIIFHCKIGKRSYTAYEYAIGLGFRNVKNYKGSWTEWAEREGLAK